MKYIKTKRLILRDWKNSDIAPFTAMNRDPDVRRYFPELITPEESKQFVFEAQKDIEDRGFGLFAIERRDTGEFIGYTGVQVLEEDGPFNLEFFPCIEIGWRLIKKHWNQGFATEAATGVLKFIKRNTEIKEVYAYSAERNFPSINIMRKLGMEEFDTFLHPLIEDHHSLKKQVVYKIKIEKQSRFKMS
jgi:RimJ/RimL family protein N-acetyltransferase